MPLNTAYLEDTLVQTEQNQGLPTLEGAADGGDSIFANLFSTAVDLGESAARRYLGPQKANARENQNALEQKSQDKGRLTLWIVAGAAVVLVVVLFLRRK